MCVDALAGAGAGAGAGLRVGAGVDAVVLVLMFVLALVVFLSRLWLVSTLLPPLLLMLKLWLV